MIEVTEVDGVRINKEDINAPITKKTSVDSLETSGYYVCGRGNSKSTLTLKRLEEILKCEEHTFNNMKHKSAIYLLEKDSSLSLSEKHAEIEAIVDYEAKKTKVKMLKELIQHFENIEKRNSQ